MRSARRTNRRRPTCKMGQGICPVSTPPTNARTDMPAKAAASVTGHRGRSFREGEIGMRRSFCRNAPTTPAAQFRENSRRALRFEHLLESFSQTQTFLFKAGIFRPSFPRASVSPCVVIDPAGSPYFTVGRHTITKSTTNAGAGSSALLILRATTHLAQTRLTLRKPRQTR